jgi:hypothetical protein
MEEKAAAILVIAAAGTPEALAQAATLASGGVLR